jgi:hypothetical protein
MQWGSYLRVVGKTRWCFFLTGEDMIMKVGKKEKDKR